MPNTGASVCGAAVVVVGSATGAEVVGAAVGAESVTEGTVVATGAAVVSGAAVVDCCVAGAPVVGGETGGDDAEQELLVSAEVAAFISGYFPWLQIPRKSSVSTDQNIIPPKPTDRAKHV